MMLVYCRKVIFLLPSNQSIDKRVSQIPGVFLPQLEELQKYFFDLVANGNILEVKSFLQERPNFNINIVNFQVFIYLSRLIIID